ncbi:MAG TPA: ABC transporter permease [Noviherbaspirillum sp.]|jgi:phospholipid/cholesterol/gamma-HCH transport system permease protein|uniref:MlaE family ABC transporter permease n=1 Tax=Noviherbaspirillum sp. TaxID=1926288 RepID=UPI002DDC90AB|nr:ABC transporter permease [Noviherbaspirillum sp.]HEV2610318.1 ABC transporter permease [Noviherbaspirillum sp.]
MFSSPPTPFRPRRWGAICRQELASWWFLALFGAGALVIALSPSTYRRANRVLIATHIYTSTWRVLLWFTLASMLVSLVLIRIVAVTALSYGLSQYALEMMVRVLVLELIPLSAALFVALRAGLAFNAGALPVVPEANQPTKAGNSALDFHVDVVPEVIANVFSVFSLALMSSAVVLVLAYLNVYGLSPWGLMDYTRTVGRVFDPVVTVGFALKTLLFGLAVAIIPMAAMLERPRRADSTQASVLSTVQPGAMRLFFVLLLIESGSLAVKYI